MKLKKFSAVILVAALLVTCGVFQSSAVSLSVEGQGNEQVERAVFDAKTTQLVLDSDELRFDVTVPTVLPFHRDSDNNVYTATDARIINNSAGDVRVASIEVEEAYSPGGGGGYWRIENDSTPNNSLDSDYHSQSSYWHIDSKLYCVGFNFSGGDKWFGMPATKDTSSITSAVISNEWCQEVILRAPDTMNHKEINADCFGSIKYPGSNTSHNNELSKGIFEYDGVFAPSSYSTDYEIVANATIVVDWDYDWYYAE